MKRTIKFRGKDIETGKWIDGGLIQRMGYMPSIMFPYESNGKVRYGECAVKRETVGQFTGLLDKNGKEIYEGDILRRIGRDIEKDRISKVEYIGSGFQFGILEPLSMHNDRMEVIGNIHDNPELLK